MEMKVIGNELNSSLNVESFLKLDLKLTFFEPDTDNQEIESGDLNVCKIIKDVIKSAVNHQSEPKVIYNINAKIVIEVLSTILGGIFSHKIFQIDERKQQEPLGGCKYEWCLKAKVFHCDHKNFYPLITKDSISKYVKPMDEIFRDQPNLEKKVQEYLKQDKYICQFKLLPNGFKFKIIENIDDEG